ncbi:hypothetical protein FZEAL_6060 [Fusarium zealandicum]|uniref:DUF8004 domain-containing protein n=1 Tax=Fusarium zealandicum TaxID=1053134 RepID=A0A8H4UII8_9HYPO|nr:hypothetical protein FZEAL_6060 [Fusarium zealandicum]
MASSGRSPRLRNSGVFADANIDHHATVKRWDGAARTCTDWDNIRRDPELWFRNGNCLVHLYGRGQSRRGPSFKVPFSALLETQCYPLIDRFVAWDGIRKPNVRQLTKWSRKNPTRRIEMFIPSPPTTDKNQAFHYHLATRNFFAWVFRRSMVGSSLGGALIGLVHSMHEFRAGVDDNVSDMMEYFDEEGYLDMANQPDLALAMLQLAEFFEMKELYVRAFTHCVGMGDLMFDSPVFQELSPQSRKLIRKGRVEMDYRMSQSSTMLKTFLDDELSEAHLSVSAGARAHLERFRSFLLSFYTTKLGYYPPGAVDPDCEVFDSAIYRTMREDFEALYDLLVDDQYTSSDAMSPTAHGGICTYQLVQSFDLEHEYEPLEHPLPLLPELGDHNSRRMSWLPGLRSDRRVTAHAALTNASNLMKPGVSQNDLVRAYRRFEEDSIMSPNKADKLEKVSLVDARKVRWTLIYATYQVLRSATEAPHEVEDDHDEARYSLSVSTANVPPWNTPREMGRILRRQTQFVTGGLDWSIHEDSHMEGSNGRIEIKPDVDYFALTHKERPQSHCDSRMVDRRASVPSRPSRSNSLTQALSRSSTIRRSMRMFKSPAHTPPQTATPPPRPTHCEIVVHGYGNGTKDVGLDGEAQCLDVTGWPVRSDSMGSKADDLDGTSPESMESNDDTIDSPLDTPPLVEYCVEPPIPKDVKARREKRRDVMSMVARSVSGRVSKRRPMSAIFSDSSKYADSVEDMVEQRQRQGSLGRSSKPSSRHSMLLPDLRRKGTLTHSMTMPARIFERRESASLEIGDGEPYIVSEDADWAAMQSFITVSPGERPDDDVMPAWEQYADLGGLTDMR